MSTPLEIDRLMPYKIFHPPHCLAKILVKIGFSVKILLKICHFDFEF